MNGDRFVYKKCLHTSGNPAKLFNNFVRTMGGLNDGVFKEKPPVCDLRYKMYHDGEKWIADCEVYFIGGEKKLSFARIVRRVKNLFKEKPF